MSSEENMFRAQEASQLEIEESGFNELDNSDAELLRSARANPDAQITTLPVKQKLRIFSVMCLIINRMIGTGIFSTTSVILKGTNSVASTIILWVLGAFFTALGLTLYLELGLSIPRYVLRDSPGGVAVPRSGGEKNYLEYIYRKPKYLATCVYGVIFICLGNTAGNAIAFSQHLLEACNVQDPLPWAVRGVAIAAITLACLMHGLWRVGGIYVNNILATIKVGTLLVIIGCGFAAYGKAFPNVTTNTFKSGKTFEHTSLYGFSEAMLAVVFSYGGYTNAHYVLSEVFQPQRTLKIGAYSAVALVSVLYILTNIAYFGALSKDEIMNAGTEVAAGFFKKVFGETSRAANRVLPAFIALSALGNIVVVTFVSARVKQEIAKEGVLPFSRFFAANTITLPSRWRSRGPTPTEFENPDFHAESTPIAALLLHWIFSMILVISPPVGDAYVLFVNLYSYTINVWIGFLIAAGLFWLHCKPGSDWLDIRTFKPRFTPYMAFFYCLVNAFLIITPFIPPEDGQLAMKSIKWFVFPTIGTGLFLLGGVYWGIFVYVWPRYYKRELLVQRTSILVDRVEKYELVLCSWVVPGSTVEPNNYNHVELEAR
ncbi:amino acid permease-domain-containing protein [Geopyxis carbonaria]|nr:amino acid permease-domain-containing protein [Geopyxis carbonaria]